MNYDRYMQQKRRQDTRALLSAITAVVLIVGVGVWAWSL